MTGRTSYIIGRASWHFLTAAVLTTMASMLAITTDAIIVGQLISPDALSGINALTPVMIVMSAIAMLVGNGAGVRMSRLVGLRDVRATHRAYSVALPVILIVGVAMTVLLNVFADEIVDVMCDDERIAPWSAQYLSIYAYAPVTILLNNFLCYCVQIDGRPALATRIILGGSVFNIIADLVLIGVCGMGMQGSAVATVVSYVLIISLAWHYGLRGSDTYHFIPRVRGWGKELLLNLKDGVPLTIGNAAIALLVFIINSIVIDALGTVGMNTWSVCLQLLMLAMTIFTGVNNTALTIGSQAMGEGDMPGLRRLHTLVMRMAIGSTLAFVMLVECAPELMLRLFGADDEMMQSGAPAAMRMFVLCMVPLALTLIRQSFLTALQHYVLSIAMSVGLVVIIPVGVWGMTQVSADSLWWGFVLSLATLNIIVAAAMLIIHKDGTSPWTLIPWGERGRAWSTSVAYNEQSLGEMLGLAAAFMRKNGIGDGVVVEAQSVLNTLSHDTMSAVGNASPYQQFDIHLRIHDDGELRITLKNDAPRHVPAQPQSVQHKYMYAQNVLTVTLPKD